MVVQCVSAGRHLAHTRVTQESVWMMKEPVKEIEKQERIISRVQIESEMYTLCSFGTAETVLSAEDISNVCAHEKRESSITVVLM